MKWTFEADGAPRVEGGVGDGGKAWSADTVSERLSLPCLPLSWA